MRFGIRSRLGLASVVAAAVLCATPIAANADPLEDARAAYQRHDYAAALRLWRPLAEQGSAPAAFGVGSIYDQGLGVPQDFVEAVKWYREAANQGDGRAQFNLGQMVAQGRGAPKDNVCALFWYNLAAAKGVEYAYGEREALELAISPREVAKAQALSRDWKPTNAEGARAMATQDVTCAPKPPSGGGIVAED